jgi:hypothetical protein
MKKQLKMFVWEDVLYDHTPGMVCILAHDLEECKSIFLKKFPDEQYILDDFFGKKHKEIIEPEAFYVCGGG